MPEPSIRLGRRRTHRWFAVLGALALCWVGLVKGQASADEASVAVAANFLGPMKVLQDDFGKATGHRLTISGGSTGEFYNQIKNRAPFDLFLSADQKRPKALEEEGLAVEGSRFTYAAGRLVLWSADPAFIKDDGPAVLKAGNFRQLALANPKVAPYGEAAVKVMKGLDLYAALEPKLVLGQSLSQTYQFVALRTAELGFLALSQVRAIAPGEAPGSYWLVPQEMHDPILQDAVLLKHGQDNAAARAFVDYLKGDQARGIIEESGYTIVPY
jgi:molybdate transport system substrate-binding protein